MFKNYLKIVIRNIYNKKINSFINIIGFTIALFISFLLILTIHHECSYDSFHEKNSQIYKILLREKNDKSKISSLLPFPLLNTLKENFSAIEKSSCFFSRTQLIKKDDKKYNERVNYVSSDFLDIFSFKIIYGHKLNKNNSKYDILISEQMALKYFGDENSINQMLEIQGKPFNIVGVVENVKQNSSLQFNFLSVAESLPYYNFINRWNVSMAKGFILINSEQNISELKQEIKDIIQQHSPQSNKEIFLQPLRKIHLSGIDNMSGGADEKSIKFLLIMVVVILVVASINYINMATAQSMKRAMDIGIRKVVGASKFQIMIQIVLESLIIVLIAFSIAMIAVVIFLPNYNTLTGFHINSHIVKNVSILSFLLFISIGIALLSAIYPAIVLSSFKPITIISKLSTSHGQIGSILRNILVMIQLSFAILFFVLVSIFYSQSHFLMNSNLGYNKELILCYSLTNEQQADYKIIKNSLSKIPAVNSICGTSRVPGMGYSRSSSDWSWKGKPNKQIIYHQNKVDYDFQNIFEMKMKEGRFFSKEYGDQNSIVINETAANVIGFESIIGQNIKISDNDYQIIGVIKDYHMVSLLHKIEPLILFKSDEHSTLIVKVKNKNDLNSAKTAINKTLKSLHPNSVLNYGILAEFLNHEYPVFQRNKKMITIGSLFIVCILILGLYGLIAYIAERKTKEIAIRKILGAKASNILYSIIRGFLILIIISSLFGITIGHLLAINWLNNFAYRTDISIWNFIVPIILTILITLMTVGYLSYKTAKRNPVDSLKYE